MGKKNMDPKQCPWCERWCLKDTSCNYIFACGLESKGKFVVGAGCGRSWCWECGKKFCTRHYDPVTGVRVSDRTNHDAECCSKEEGFSNESYCCGGHNSHCAKRW